MSWIFETYIQPSEKNGVITVRRWFGRWSIYVDGYDNTSPYLQKMWRTLFKKFVHPKDIHAIKNVLMLGLGAGGEIKTLHTLFPFCNITVVEYDRAMIELTRKFELYRPFPAPDIIYGDAEQAISQLSKQYDIIIVDIFKSSEPSPLSRDPNFLQKVRALLTDEGFVFINIFRKEPGSLDIARTIFPIATFWKYKYNTLGILQKA